ncbi:hypothetical protein [Mesorhizobium sp. ISC11]|uniref:hypothetical protein n=1 Tax=Mesorhizobium sp. ISC11 TaxID=3076428 RepID=UPI00301C0521
MATIAELRVKRNALAAAWNVAASDPVNRKELRRLAIDLDEVEGQIEASYDPTQGYAAGLAKAEADVLAIVEVCVLANAPLTQMVDLLNSKATLTDAIVAVRHLAN